MINSKAGLFCESDIRGLFLGIGSYPTALCYVHNMMLNGVDTIVLSPLGSSICIPVLFYYSNAKGRFSTTQPSPCLAQRHA
jgi:hypothetical protein